MKRLLSCALCALVTAGGALGATEPAAHGVTLEEFLQTVRSSHPFFQREMLQADIEKAVRERHLGGKDWLVESTPSFLHSEPVQSSPFDPERIDVLTLNARAARAYWGNGSRITVAWVTDVTDQSLPGLPFPDPGGAMEIPIGASTFYSHELRATYSIPLMRNRGGALDRLDYELSGYDVDLSEVRALENQETFLLEKGARFIEWVLLGEQRRIARDRLSLADEELERTRRKRRSNLVDEADVLRAQDAVQATRQVLLLIESRWKATRAELATVAGDDELYQTDPQMDLYRLPALDPIEDAVTAVTAGSRLVRVLRWQESRLAHLEDGLDAAAQPELALNLIGALKGGDESFGKSFEVTQPDVGIGLEFRYPLGNRAATADVYATRLQRRQLEFAVRSVQVELAAAARNILVQLDELDGVLRSNVAQIETARLKTQEELKVYNQGRGDLTFVIQSRDAEARSKLAYAENAALYHTLVLQYRELADQLLPTLAGK